MSDPIPFEGSTARLALPMLFAGQAQKEFTVNEALLRADIALQCVVEGEAAAPPASPAAGQAWLVADAPSGDFAGHALAIAGWTADGWRFVTPREGFVVFDRTAQCFRKFSGTWERPVAPAGPSGGATIDAEARAAIVSLIEILVAAGVLAST